MLILVKDTVTTHVEDLNELLWCAQSKQVIDVLTFLFIHESDVCIIEQTFLSEISIADCLPKVFALASAADHRASLRDQLVDLVSWNICQA